MADTLTPDSAPDDLVLSGRRTIQKEAQALAAFVDTLDASFAEACQRIFRCRGTVLVTGMGKSGLVARKWAATFSGTGTKAYFLNAADAAHGDLGILHGEDILIALSFSGETEELGSVLRFAKENGIPSIAVTRDPQSSVARQTTLTLSLEVKEEACPLGLAPTTSTTLMMALGDALAVTLMEMRGFTERDFAKLHPGGSLGRRLFLRVDQLMHSGNAIPKVAPEDDLKKVLLEMTSKRLGLAVVMENDRVSGIITDGDLRRYFQSHLVTDAIQASALMTRNPKQVAPDALAIEARELMEKSAIHQLLIQNTSGKLEGVVHVHDLLRAKVL